MEIILAGGPYDGEIYDFELDTKGKPIPFLNLRQRLIAPVSLADLDPRPQKALPFIRYTLRMVADKEWKDGLLQLSKDKWHWEYHFDAEEPPVPGLTTD